MPPDHFTFYFTIGADEWQPKHLTTDVPVLFPASSYARYKFRTLHVPDLLTNRAADCGGFVATFKWGDYRYTPEQYTAWCDQWSPNWAATMDYCCEDEITSGRSGVVRERQDKTTAMAYHFWGQYQSQKWAWVPTVQGWDVSDYQRHARELRPLLLEMQQFYQERDGIAHQFRVGIGTLCRRVSIQKIVAIVMAVHQELPEIECFHLWGVKTGLWKSNVFFPFRFSSDSAAWNMKAYYGQREPEWKRWCAEQAELGFKESNRSHRYKVLIPETQAAIETYKVQLKQSMLF